MTDRIRATALPADQTAHEQVLHRILAMPSLAAQLLTAAADHLTEEEPTAPLTAGGWGYALALADCRILSGYPQTVAENAGRRAMASLSPELWATARTRGEWAVFLRSAARAV
ncbi:hypothetical protein ACFWXI_06635 [[Kitasatospora] papulosa]|uniref:hypothetical protein n=1 Tax=[Kitasatospora] papulosa TaxID=1464011 RepID=UPI0036BB99DD